MRLYFAETQGASRNVKPSFDRDIRARYDEVLEQNVTVMTDRFLEGVVAK